MMKRLVFFLTSLLISLSQDTSAQNLIVKNATPVNLTLTDFIYLNPLCTAPKTNFYGINFRLPGSSYSHPPVSHQSSGWKLVVSDGTNLASVMDDTPVGCGKGYISTARLGNYTITWRYEANGDILLQIF